MCKGLVMNMACGLWLMVHSPWSIVKAHGLWTMTKRKNSINIAVLRLQFEYFQGSGLVGFENGGLCWQ